MPKWRQDKETGELVPIDQAAYDKDVGAGIFPGAKPFEAFRSTVDGSIIRNYKELEEHNKRNNVVLAAEFSQEYYDRKAKERAAYFQGKVSEREQFERRQQIYEIMTRAEQHGR